MEEDKNSEIPNPALEIVASEEDPVEDVSPSERRLDDELAHISLRCKKDYFYNDGASNECEKVPSNEKIKNCVYYLSDKKCLYCKAKYISDSTSCDPLNSEDEIDKCEFQYNKD